MTLLQAILLALVQGVTEFLPISSSAHLILLPYLFAWNDQGLAFDVAVNTGTLVAVIAYFRRDLLQLASGVLTGAVAAVEGLAPRRLVAFLVLATIPVAVIGLLVSDWIETSARNPTLIAVTSILFGLLLWVADRWGRRLRDLAQLQLADAVLIGLGQALALIPGTSRSGITITVALLLGLHRPAAARFSMLLAIPVGLLAAGWDGLKIVTGKVPAGDLLPMAVGFSVAALSAYLVIGWLLAWVQRRTMTVFVIYRVALGLAILGVAALLAGAVS